MSEIRKYIDYYNPYGMRGTMANAAINELESLERDRDRLEEIMILLKSPNMSREVHVRIYEILYGGEK